MDNNCLIIAGEKSGEEHSQSFFKVLKDLCPQIHFWGVGGDYLKGQDVELVYHLKDFSSIGFTSVLFKIPFYIKALRKLTRMAKVRNCRCAILIDFQDFNLRLAKRLKKQGVEVLYYVAPQAWAWKEYRASVLAEVVHTLFTILPFEKKWFSDRGVKNIVGLKHPLYGRFNEIIKEREYQKNILLLPGSRNIEVENLLPVFMAVIDHIKKNYDVTISMVESGNVRAELYEPYRAKIDKIYIDDQLELALKKGTLCLAASGTVTLATALFAIPTIVTYKVSAVNWWVYKTFVNYTGPVSLANIVHQKRIFPELIQDEATVEKIESVLINWLNNEQECFEIESKLCNTKELLQGDDISVAEYMGKVINGAHRN